MKQIAATGLCAVLLTALSFGQFHLNNFNSRSVREGYMVPTIIDTVLLDTRVNSGVAVSRLTLVVQPGAYNDFYYTEISPMLVDSIEMQVSFQLPTDFVADSMWLWVDGEPVEAYIQDRALASAQYNQIVGTRRDPAILEFSGNGYYNLRIFPASSMNARKIAIQFNHTFDDDSADVITASIPLHYATIGYYSYYYNNVKESIGYFSATFSALDHSNYNVDIPGLGSGVFSWGSPLVLSSRNILSIIPGTISSTDPSGLNDYLWTSVDHLQNKMSAGFAVEISDKSIYFDPEPQTRMIVLDMRNRHWDWNEYYKMQADHYGNTFNPYYNYENADIWVRAQKFAVLCMQHYLSEKQKFNLIIGGATPQALFDRPVFANPENIEKAIIAILNASPSSSSSTLDLVREVIKQDSSALTILISDLFQPYDYYESTNYTVSSIGTRYNSELDSLDSLVKSSGMPLFTIDDNWRLSQISYESGGYRLADIINRFNVTYKYEVVDGRRITIPLMPPLFGSSNSSGIRDVEVECSDLDDIVFTTDGYSYNWWSNSFDGGGAVLRVAKLALPNSYNTDIAFMRIAGQGKIAQTDAPLQFTIKGKMGGLRFRKEISARGSYNSESNGNSTLADVQWAFRKSEALAGSDYINNVTLIKAIGKEYHIVTRQTSLLALEPGMELWEDTLWSSQNVEVKAVASTIRVSSDMPDISYSTEGSAPYYPLGPSSGLDFDGISLESILALNGVSVDWEKPLPKKTKMSVTTFGNMIRLQLPEIKSEVSLQLFDLRGSLVAQKRITNSSNNLHLWNLDAGDSKISGGFYTLCVKVSGSQKKVFRVPLIGR